MLQYNFILPLLRDNCRQVLRSNAKKTGACFFSRFYKMLPDSFLGVADVGDIPATFFLKPSNR